MVFELQAELGDSPFVVSSLGTAPRGPVCFVPRQPGHSSPDVLERTAADSSSYEVSSYVYI